MEAEVVFELGTLDAFFEVDALRDVHDWARVVFGVRLAHNRVQSLTFPFHSALKYIIGSFHM